MSGSVTLTSRAESWECWENEPTENLGLKIKWHSPPTLHFFPRKLMNFPVNHVTTGFLARNCPTYPRSSLAAIARQRRLVSGELLMVYYEYKASNSGCMINVCNTHFWQFMGDG